MGINVNFKYDGANEKVLSTPTGTPANIVSEDGKMQIVITEEGGEGGALKIAEGTFMADTIPEASGQVTELRLDGNVCTKGAEHYDSVVFCVVTYLGEKNDCMNKSVAYMSQYGNNRVARSIDVLYSDGIYYTSGEKPNLYVKGISKFSSDYLTVECTNVAGAKPPTGQYKYEVYAVPNLLQ